MKTLKEQQAEAWRIAPDDANGIRQAMDAGTGCTQCNSQEYMVAFCTKHNPTVGTGATHYNQERNLRL